MEEEKRRLAIIRRSKFILQCPRLLSRLNPPLSSSSSSSVKIMTVTKRAKQGSNSNWQAACRRRHFLKGAVKSLRGGDGVAWTRKHNLGKGSFGFVSFATSRAPIIVCHDDDDGGGGGGGSDSVLTNFAVKSAEVSMSSSLRRETKILWDLKLSPRVVQSHGDEMTQSRFDNRTYYNILMEFCEGGSLAKWIKKLGNPGLSEYHVRLFARDMVLGLVHVHSRGYVHCDIKPSNILLARDGDGYTAKIADFGLAKRVAAHPNGEEDDDELGAVRGTYRYMAPETVSHRVQDQYADIWALGCTVLEMMTGKPLWDSQADLSHDSQIKDILQRIGNSPEWPELPSDISRDGKDFLERCLVRSLRSRWSAKMLIHHPFLSLDLTARS